MLVRMFVATLAMLGLVANSALAQVTVMTPTELTDAAVTNTVPYINENIGFGLLIFGAVFGFFFLMKIIRRSSR